MTQPEAKPWEPSYPQGVSWSEPLRLSTAGDYLEAASRRWPEKTAIELEGETVTYRRLCDLVQQAANAFAGMGVRRGAHVAVLLPNSIHHTIACFGAFRAGATVVNLSCEAAVRELELQIADTDVQLLVSTAAGAIGEKVREVLQTTRVPQTVLCDPEERIAAIGSAIGHQASIPAVASMDFSTFLAAGETPAELDRPGLDDIALIQFTGGTTGVPKGAMLRHSNISASVEITRRWLGGFLTEEGRMALAPLPMSHIFGFYSLLTYLATGTPIVLHRRFNPFEAIAEFGRHRVTLFLGVPTMFAAMLATGGLSKAGMAKLRVCGAGGAPLTPQLAASFAAATGHQLREGFGMSETSANGVWQPVLSAPKAGATGLPLPQTTIEVVDLETGERVLPVGEVGEVCIRGPQVMAGYWKRGPETEWAFRGGRFHTGDVGVLQEDGYLKLVDRKKDMILNGGFNVFPAAVEAALSEHPAVLEAAVVGVPDDFMGQVPKAVLRCRPGAAPCGFDELLDFLKPRLATYEMPVMVEWRDELPKTYVGKIARNRLLDQVASR